MWKSLFRKLKSRLNLYLNHDLMVKAGFIALWREMGTVRYERKEGREGPRKT